MKTVKININFDCFTLREYIVRRIIKTCIIKTLAYEGMDVPCEINVLVTDDKGIRAINNASRGIDAATDVLSFPMFQLEAGILPEDDSVYCDPETGLCPLGDLAISLERAISQAKQYGHSMRREIGYLTIHSILHLLGYDHINEGPDKAKMRDREEKIASTICGLERK